MRRIYFTTPKRQRLEREVMLTYRRAVMKVSPELRESARQAIVKAYSAMEQQEQDFEQLLEAHADKIPIDRCKNLAVVMKFLELCPDNPDIRKKIKNLLN